MPDPLIISLANDFRQELLAREAAAMQEMARRWLGVEAALQTEAAALAEELAAKQAAGQPISRSKLYEMERYQRLLAQTREQIALYQGAAQGMIERQQNQAAVLGSDDGLMLLKAAGPEVSGYFDRLGIEAVEQITAIARAGKPLNELLRAAYPLATEGITQALLNGTAAGVNPREVARQMLRDGLAQGLNHILLVSRDQMIRAYREGSRQQYLKNGIWQYRRLCAKQTRTCLACLALDGTVYDTADLMALHPQDRCTMIPIVPGFEALTWQSGSEWFAEQPPDAQREMMGPRMFEAWSQGAFDFNRLAKVTDNPVWGPGAQVRPLKELLKRQ